MNKSIIRLQITAIVIGVALMVFKFWGWSVTHSNALFSDAAESVINILAGCFALYSLFLVTKPKDWNHPYGHGKIAFISVGLEGGLIFLAGLVIIWKGIYNLVFPQPIEQLGWGIGITVVGGLVNLVLGYFLLKRGRQHKSLILEADGEHLLTDAYSSVGVLVGLLLVRWTGFVWIDNLTAALFGVFILVTGVKLLRTSTAGIMDEADEQLLKNLVANLEKNKSDNWIDVHNFRVIKYGKSIHIDCHLTLPYYFDVEKAHEEVKAFELLHEQSLEAAVELFVHVDPCEKPVACSICRKADCDKRIAKMEKSIAWTLENIRKNQKHHAF